MIVICVLRLLCCDSNFFSLCLKDLDFDFGEKKEINFAPYLQFKQR